MSDRAILPAIIALLAAGVAWAVLDLVLAVRAGMRAADIRLAPLSRVMRSFRPCGHCGHYSPHYARIVNTDTPLCADCYFRWRDR